MTCGLPVADHIGPGAVMTRVFAVAAVAGIAALLGGSALWVAMSRAADPHAQCRTGLVAGGDIGGPFTLIDDTGATVTDRDVITGPTLVYFGYTWCPDVCPVDAARNAEATDILEEMGLNVTPVFISFDPARDTPDVLAQFTDGLHPRMIGLTGSEDQLAVAGRAYKTYFKVRNPGEADALYDHLTFTYLMQPGPDGTPVFVDFFNRDETADRMATRVACFQGVT